jgi:hypothetical protein
VSVLSETLLANARDVRAAWKRMPEWVREGSGIPHELDVAMCCLRETLDAIELAEYEAKRPAALSGLAPWLVGRPFVFDGRRPWGVATTDGRVGATDGMAILLLDAGEAPPLTWPGFETPAECDARAGALMRMVAKWKGPTATTAEALRSWLDQAEPADRGAAVARIGDATFDAALLRAWILPAAELSGGEVLVRWRGALDPARFEGFGWTALVMPRREETPKGPQLAEEHQ